MKNYFLIFVFICVFSTSIYATMSPELKECVQRGYKIGEEGCIMPNGTICSIQDFNNDLCGQEFKTEDYCVPEGRPIWDEDKCCEGLKPYLPAITFGHPTCEPFSERLKGNISSPFTLIIVITIILVGVLFYLRIKKNR